MTAVKYTMFSCKFPTNELTRHVLNRLRSRSTIRKSLTKNWWSHREPSKMQFPVKSAPVQREGLDVGEVVVVYNVDDGTDDSLSIFGYATCKIVKTCVPDILSNKFYVLFRLTLNVLSKHWWFDQKCSVNQK